MKYLLIICNYLLFKPFLYSLFLQMFYFWRKSRSMKSVHIFSTFFFLTIGLSAQSYERSYDHHDISIGYGIFIPDQFKNVESSMLDERYPDKRYVRDEYSSTGAIFITYRHVLKNEVMLFGVTAGISSSASKIYNVGQFEGDLTRQFITVAVEWEYRYVNQGLIQVYSGLGLGYTYGTEKLSPPSELGTPEATGDISSIAYQLNAVGVRLGKKYAGFVEFGYGYKGIVNIGFSVQLY